MNIEIRKMIYKFPIVHKACIKLVDINNLLFYKRYTRKHHQDEIVRAMRENQKSKRCFIVGNGPSLTTEDLELIKNETSFASNLIFRIFDKTDWRPTYYFLQDRYADTQNVLDTLDVKHLFIGEYYWRKRGMNNPNAICMRVARNIDINNPNFSEDITKEVFDMQTITYTMIQVAVYLGFTEIYLLGMDHSYALSYDSSGHVMEDPNVLSHFFTDKNPKDVIANIEAMNKAYIAARDYADTHGIRILNATRGGKLEWFPRKSLKEILK